MQTCLCMLHADAHYFDAVHSPILYYICNHNCRYRPADTLRASDFFPLDGETVDEDGKCYSDIKRQVLAPQPLVTIFRVLDFHSTVSYT